MLKTLKIIIIAFFFSLFTLNYVQAVDINMNLSENTTNSTNNIQNASQTNLSSENTVTQASSDYLVSLSTMPEEELGFTNILNIVIIVIGILLIFLAIAILIRLKNI